MPRTQRCFGGVIWRWSTTPESLHKGNTRNELMANLCFPLLFTHTLCHNIFLKNSMGFWITLESHSSPASLRSLLESSLIGVLDFLEPFGCTSQTASCLAFSHTWWSTAIVSKFHWFTKLPYLQVLRRCFIIKQRGQLPSFDANAVIRKETKVAVQERDPENTHNCFRGSL